MMNATKLKLGLAVLVLAGATTAWVGQNQTEINLRGENQSLRQQIVQLQAVREAPSKLAAPAREPAALSNALFNELVRLRGEVGGLRAQTNELARLREDHQDLLTQLAIQAESTNEVSAADQFILQKTHTVDALTTVLNAVKNYAANHYGQYPGSLDQLAASSELGAIPFPGNLRLGAFKLTPGGTAAPGDQPGNQITIGIQIPLKGPGGGSTMVVGGIDDAGVVFTKTYAWSE